MVGSATSSNSVRLAEVARLSGARVAKRVDNAGEIDEGWFNDVATVGVTSGASVPEALVRDVLGLLAEYGFDEVEEVETTTEDLMFALPKELRRDLKAAGIASSNKPGGADRRHDLR